MGARYTLNTYTREVYEKDVKLVGLIEKNYSIDFSSLKKHLEYKKKILRDFCEYRNLRIGADGSEIPFWPLDKATPGRINSVLKQKYILAKNRIARYGDPSKRKKSGKLEEKILFKIDKNGQYCLF